MRVEDAPPAGWYPDPEGGSRLRWWEGTDWSDRYRAPPTPGVVEIKAAYEQEHGMGEHAVDEYAQQYQRHAPVGGLSRADSDAIIAQVRMAAREEAQRAAEMFGAQARSATQSLGPLISEYTSKFTRWFKVLTRIAIVILILWLAFQIFAQVSLFEWIGDRIDNITDNIDDNGGAVFLRAG